MIKPRSITVIKKNKIQFYSQSLTYIYIHNKGEREGFSGLCIRERGEEREREHLESYNVGLQMSNFDGCSIHCTDYVKDSFVFLPPLLIYFLFACVIFVLEMFLTFIIYGF